MKISVPLLAAFASVLLSFPGLSPAQTTPEPAPSATPAPSAPASTPAAAAPQATPAKNAKKPPGPISASADVRIDANGIHVGGPNAVDISTGSGPVGTILKVLPLVAVLAPFATLLGAFGIILYFRHRRMTVLHETLRAMVEKGLPIPPELITRGAGASLGGRSRTGRSDLRGGLMMLSMGLALCFVSGKWGLIPFAIGAALLVVWFLEQREKQPEKSSLFRTAFGEAPLEKRDQNAGPGEPKP